VSTVAYPDNIPATCTFKGTGDRTVEHRRYDGGAWVVGVEGWDREMTPAQARILARELNDAASSVQAMNRRNTPAPNIQGRELLLLEMDAVTRTRDVFADGKPKRIIRQTNDQDDAVRFYPIADSVEHAQTVTSRTEGRGKHKETYHYELLGWYELIIAGSPDTRTMLVAKVEHS
jgi:hypothetical protein